MSSTTSNPTFDNPSLSSGESSVASGSWKSWLIVIGLIYLLLVAVGAIGDGFKLATGSNAKELFSFATNPIIALIIGLVATALIQSSSTVTSIIVGLVAGGMPLQIAIPMVMGANIGTSLTSTIVSLGSIREGVEFRRAFSAATIHDCFNILAVALMLPLEIFFGVLEKISHALVGLFHTGSNISMSDMNFMKVMLAPGMDVIKAGTGWLPGIWGGVLMIILGVVMILWVVSAIGKVLKKVLVGQAKKVLHAAVGRGPISGMASGTLITMMVQSSSTTTALIVPMAAAGVFNLRQVYAFTLGTNIGTTITALLAATAISGPTASLALQIALVHVFFNVLGILIIFGLPFLRPLPVTMAEGLAGLAIRNKVYVAAYILGVFFVLPLVIVGINQMFFS